MSMQSPGFQGGLAAGAPGQQDAPSPVVILKTTSSDAATAPATCGAVRGEEVALGLCRSTCISIYSGKGYKSIRVWDHNDVAFINLAVRRFI